uniref:hypothetical protein n=1 Tax=Aeromonas sp. Ne-1 TaxID=1675689 RepID=UPI0015641DF7|nr:hypothetical protein [Aeromonas sp. Ne-1]
MNIIEQKIEQRMKERSDRKKKNKELRLVEGKFIEQTVIRVKWWMETEIHILGRKQKKFSTVTNKINLTEANLNLSKTVDKPL